MSNKIEMEEKTDDKKSEQTYELSQGSHEKDDKPNFKKALLISVIGLIIAGVAAQFYFESTMYVSTDDAYVEGDIVPIASKVAGNITKIYVGDNQKVKEGELIAQIDPRDYQVQYNQAVARLESAIARKKGASSNVDLTSITADANSGQAQAAFEQANQEVMVAKAEQNYARADFERYTTSYSKGVVTKQDLDRVATNYKVAKNKLNAAYKGQNQAFEKAKASNTVNQQIAVSEAQVKGADADIKQLKAAVDQAALNLSYTKIYAPIEGNITGKNIEKGAFVQIGQPILTIVPQKRWIIANFKETQIENMRIGQSVSIKIDAYPHKVFKGHVDSIQAASGAKASLFPPENAVGSFVKVVQRVPVKITFDDKMDSQITITPGMSVVPKVKVKN